MVHHHISQPLTVELVMPETNCKSNSHSTYDSRTVLSLQSDAYVQELSSKFTMRMRSEVASTRHARGTFPGPSPVQVQSSQESTVHILQVPKSLSSCHDHLRMCRPCVRAAFSPGRP